MSKFTPQLWDLAEEFFHDEDLRRMHAVVETHPLSFEQLFEFDEMLGGASMSQLNHNGTGHYHPSDSDVFRSLQYCAMYFDRKYDMNEVEWHARLIVQMSGLHIESLLNRVGDFFGFTLGHVLHDKRIRKRIGIEAWGQIARFRKIYSAAKHEIGRHVFSVEDAVLVYFVSRRLSESFYPLAKLRTRFPPAIRLASEGRFTCIEGG